MPSVERVLARLDERMCRQFRTVLSLAKERGLTLRMAAYVLALQRIGAASDALGTARLFNGD